MISIIVQITCALKSFYVMKLIWKSNCKSQRCGSIENGTTPTSGCFLVHSILGVLLQWFMVFVRNSSTKQRWNFGISYFLTIPYYPSLIYRLYIATNQQIFPLSYIIKVKKNITYLASIFKIYFVWITVKLVICFWIDCHELFR